MAVLLAISLWPVWLGFFWVDRALCAASLGDASPWPLHLALMTIAAFGLVTFIADFPADIGAVAQRSVGPTARLLGLGIGMVVAGLDFSSIDRALLLAGAFFAATAGIAHLGLAGAVLGWPRGRLTAGRSGPELVSSAHSTSGGAQRYLLSEWPRGCREGDTVWIGDLRLWGLGEGPYRCGRVVGRAAHIVRDPSGTMALRLIQHGLLLEAWAVVTLVWAF